MHAGRMRGHVNPQPELFSVIKLEDRIDPGHPLRKIKRLADEALVSLSPDFDRMYDDTRGRNSIPPERLLKSLILIALYTVRSERQFCEQLEYNLLWRWFLDMELLEPAFDASTFSRNRDRLLDHEVARKFFEQTVEIAKNKRLLSERHFSVDGTLIEAWASMKSFQPKDKKNKRKKNDHDDDPGNPDVDFRGERRTNATHESRTDPECRLFKKSAGSSSKLCFTGNVMMENKAGLLVAVNIHPGGNRCERDGAIQMIDRVRRRRRGRLEITSIGADKNYHAEEFVTKLKNRDIKPHVAIRKGGIISPGLDERTTNNMAYLVSQRIRKRIEEAIGWVKGVGGLRKTRFKGRRRTEMWANIACATFNLLRIPRIEAGIT